MKKLLLLIAGLFTFSGLALAQGPTQCLYSGVWTPCSLIAVPQLAQAINVKVSGGAGTTITNAFGSTTVAGNSIVCLAFESAAAIPVITDGQSNTYAVVASSATTPGYSISVAQNIVGGTTNVITETTTSGAAAFQCAEVKGSAFVGQAWDLFNGQQGTGSTITFSAASALFPGELILGAAGLGGGTVNATPSLGGSNTSLVTVDAANTAVTGGAALSIFYAVHTSLSAASNFTQTFALNASQTYSGLIVSIRPAALPTVMVGAGVAGTAAGGVVTVQGQASMTKLLVTPDSVALPANQSVNEAQINGVTPLMGNGTTGTGSARVTIASDNTAFAVNSTLSAETTKVIGTARLIGNGGATLDSAPQATAPTNGIAAFGAAVNAEQTAATNGQAQRIVTDLVGKAITIPYANPENFVSGTTAAMTGTTSTSLIASPGGALRNYITWISCVNSHATVGTFVTVQDGSGGTALLTLAAGSVFGGESATLPAPLRQPTTATALFVADVTTGANVICSAVGYKGL